MTDTRLCVQRREAMIRHHFRINLPSRHFVFIVGVCVLALIVAYGLRLIATAGRLSPGANLTSRKASKAEEMLLAGAEPKLPPCPSAGTPTPQPSAQTGHHKVTLSWNESVFSPDHPERKAVGYCLYRSTKQNAAKLEPTCRDCEQINKIAIAGTGCVDDLVKDGETYYYVVTAISAGRRTSSSSNETPARIPPTKEPNSSVTVRSYPLCRASDGSQ
jgi:hypothetical protein